jgi:hypothetical protein
MLNKTYPIKRNKICTIDTLLLFMVQITQCWYHITYRHTIHFNLFLTFMEPCIVNIFLSMTNKMQRCMFAVCFPGVTTRCGCIFTARLRVLASSFFEVSWSHTTTCHRRCDSSGRVINPSQGPLSDNPQHSQQTNIHAPGVIRTHNLSRRAAEDLRLRPRGLWDRPPALYNTLYYCQRCTCLEPFFRSSSGAQIHASGNSKQVWQIPDAACTDLSSWWWVEKPLETCRALTIIKSVIQRCILLVMLKNTIHFVCFNATSVNLGSSSH